MKRVERRSSTRKILESLMSSLEKLKEQQKRDSLKIAEIRGVIKFITEVFPNSQTKVIMEMMESILEESKVRQSEDLRLLEILLSLITYQQEDIDLLREFVVLLASEKEELKEKLNYMEKWAKKREKIMKEIESYIEKQRKWLKEHK